MDIALDRAKRRRRYAIAGTIIVVLFLAVRAQVSWRPRDFPAPKLHRILALGAQQVGAHEQLLAVLAKSDPRDTTGVEHSLFLQRWQLPGGTAMANFRLPVAGSMSSATIIAHRPLMATFNWGIAKHGVTLYNSATGAPRQILQNRDHPIIACKATPDGRLLLVMEQLGKTSCRLVVWDLATDRLLSERKRSYENGTQVSYVAGNDYIVFNGAVEASQPASATGKAGKGVMGLTVVEDLRTGQEKGRIRHSASLASALSPDGQQLALSTGDIIEIRHLPDLELRHTISGGGQRSVYSLTYAPDGKLLAAGLSNGSIELWDTATAVLQRTVPSDAHWITYEVVFSSDGNTLAARQMKGTYEAPQPQRIRLCRVR